MIVGIATRFARAFDAEDYPAAERLLSETCAYSCRGNVYRGRAAIIESYRSVGESAFDDFDEITYESVVKRTGKSTARIHFVDHLRRGNRRLTFECDQCIEVGTDGLITRIEHVDLPGQREALREFMSRTDFPRSS